ncbi:unnamed protein product [Caenorhabditis angaria]|uniref:Uncharacterized protein n=1 Tax=Caenorhabditis angaria TaxID=860376 RepID=A0A9P1IK98_9PELO|nr:unnamed protein product [Caenorhabditis angaria]
MFWTVEAFENILSRFIKIEEKIDLDKNEVLNRKDAIKLLQKMGKLGDFQSPEELLQNIEELQNFPNNSEFLGISDLNHLSKRIEMKDREGIRFCTKLEAFTDLYDKQLYKWPIYPIAKKFGKEELWEKHGNCFEMISIDLFEERIHKEVSMFEVETAEEWGILLDYMFTSNWFTRKYPILRVFNENGRFFMENEVKNVLGLPKDSTYEENGIIRAMEFEDFLKILDKLKLSIFDFHLIDIDFSKTSNGRNIPVNSPNGKACILAKFAFLEGYHIEFQEEKEQRVFIETWRLEPKKIGENTPKKASQEFMISQRFAMKPGRFFDMIFTTKKSPQNQDDLIDNHRRAFMKILPKIPFDKFVERSFLEKLIDEEMSKHMNKTVRIYNVDFFKVFQLEAEFLDVKNDATNRQFVRRKRVPQKPPALPHNKNMAEILNKSVMAGLMNDNGEYSKNGGGKENIEKFMKEKVAKEMAKNMREMENNGNLDPTTKIVFDLMKM